MEHSDVPDHSPHCGKYETTLMDVLRFELRSLIGRKLGRTRPHLLPDGDRLLNLGCGASLVEGWTNADFFPRLRPWNRMGLDWTVDLRYPLPCEDEVWDGVFAEHVLEHLTFREVRRLLPEVRRTMKGGAWLRVTVPDLAKYVANYAGNPPHPNFRLMWPNGCEAIASLAQNWGHRSIWDAEQLSRYLSDAGYHDVRQVDFREGSDARILRDNPERRWETLYMEGRKS